MYESVKQETLSRSQFVRRMLGHALVAATLLLGSLAFGVFGYRLFEGMSWTDAFLNAAMLLGGMGPVNAPQTQAGKLFAGIYALYAGLIFLVTAAILFTPALHRMLHKLHWDDEG
ncbi:MAG: hypothetical protein U1F34_03985 [Gammaproteobacteria bacterium]